MSSQKYIESKQLKETESDNLSSIDTYTGYGSMANISNKACSELSNPLLVNSIDEAYDKVEGN